MEKKHRVIALFLFCITFLLFSGKKTLAQTKNNVLPGLPNCSIIGPAKVALGKYFDVRWSNSKDLMGIEAFWTSYPEDNLEPSAGYLSDKIPACPPKQDLCIWKGLVLKTAGSAMLTVRVKNSRGIGECYYNIRTDKSLTPVPTEGKNSPAKRPSTSSAKCELLTISKSKIRVGDKVKFTAVGSSRSDSVPIETMEFTVFKGKVAVYYEVVRARRVLKTNKYTATTSDFTPTEIGTDYSIEARMITG